MQVTIVGGGIIGLSTAYYLNLAGVQVSVIDRGDFSDGCSYGNAGMIVPSHFIPLAAPGVIRQGLKWLLDETSPFHIKPRLDLDLVRWLYLFARNANQKNVDQSMTLLRDMNLLSKYLYQDLKKQPGFDIGMEEKGILMLFKSEHVREEEARTALLANQLGLETRVLTAADLAQVEPSVKLDVLGGVHYPGDAHLIPSSLMKILKKHLQWAGVQFIPNTAITSFRTVKNQIKGVLTEQGKEIEVDRLVLAGGSWSSNLARSLKIALPLQGGKGYSMTLTGHTPKPGIPSILVEVRVAITPMGNDLRIAGTLEIAGLNSPVNPKRVRGILQAVPTYYPEIKVSGQNTPVWSGYRPCSPDGLPYIGRHQRYDNLYLNTGHAMMGLSLGPVSGLLMKELISEEHPSLPLGLLDPNRFS